MHNIVKCIPLVPNISIAIINDVSGQFVTPQNKLTIPHAAHRPTGNPKIGAKKLPSVAPTKSVGTISPPLNPPPSVTAVKIIFKRNTYHAQLVTKLLAITSAPAPKKSVVLNTNRISITIHAAIIILM